MVRKSHQIASIPRHVLMEYAVRIYHDLLKRKIRTDAIILYGSQAKGLAREHSDIDLAVISRDFGKDQFNDNVLVNTIGASIDTRISAVTFGFEDFFGGKAVIPLKHEIMSHGTSLL